MRRPESIPEAPAGINPDLESGQDAQSIMGRDFAPQPEHFSLTDHLPAVLGGGNRILHDPNSFEVRVETAIRDHTPEAWTAAERAATSDAERSAVRALERIEKTVFSADSKSSPGPQTF